MKSKQFTTIQLKKTTLKRLEALKSAKRNTNDETVLELIELKEACQ